MQKIIFCFVAILFAVSSAWAIDVDNERENLISLLKNNGYNYAFDKTDQSVTFRYSDKQVYWITLQSVNNGKGLGMQINRRGFSLKGEKPYLIEPSQVAMDKVNAQYPAVKMFFEDSTRVVLCEQLFVESIKSLNIETLRLYLNAFDGAAQTFEKEYEVAAKAYRALKEKARELEEAAHPKKAPEDSVIVVEQKERSILSVESFAICNLGNGGNVINDYGEMIRANDALFLRPRITVKSPEKGVFTFNVRITNSKGTPILPSHDSKYTITTQVKIEKANKSYDVEFKEFGTPKGGIWKSGNYTIEFFEGDKYLYEGTFSIN